MKRNLASVQIIKEVSPIEGADRIELVHVLGWQCVAKKGEFKAGDYCVYFEIDSFLPIKPEFEFLRSSSYKKSDLLGEGFRLKTQKFRGQISQGLCLPISIIDDTGWHGLPEGTDVTELLGVRKWEIEEKATSGGTVIGTLPPNVPHTDETRIQAMPELLKEFAGHQYYISTKMDGSSHSVSIDKNGFRVTGHSYEYKNDGKSGFYNLITKMGLKEKLEKYIGNENRDSSYSFIIQGEYCGPGIQKNRLKLNTPKWYVFTIMENGKRLSLSDMLAICTDLGLEHVPIEEIGTNLPEKYPSVEALLKRADGEYPNGGAKEGIVIRTTTPVYCPAINDYLSMKVVSNKYLLKNE